MMFKLRNESLFVLAQAAGGFYNSDQLKLIASEAEKGSALLKVTEDGSIGLLIELERLEALETSFQSQGLLLKHYRSHQLPLPRACLGELCPQHEQDALGHAIEAASALQAAFPEGAPAMRMGINGCAENCLASGTDDIHIVGEESGYKIQIGGKASELPQIGQFYVENVSPEKLGETLIHLVSTFLAQREPDESFHALVERLGVSAFESGSAAPGSSDGLEADALSDELSPEMGESLLEDAADALGDDLTEIAHEDELQVPDELLDEDVADLGELESLDDASLTDEPDLDLSPQDAPLAELALDGTELEADLVQMETDDISSTHLDELPLTSEDEVAGSDLEGEALVEAIESHQEMMEEEEGLESEEATEDDVTRVTMAMRSESAYDQGDELPVDPGTPTEPDELALAAGAAGSNDYRDLSLDQSLEIDDPSELLGKQDEETGPAPEEAFQEESAEDEDASGSSFADETEPGSLAQEGAGAVLEDDISPRFLELQDEASHQGSLQIRLVEDILSVMMPDGARINLPFAALEKGLKVIMSLGSSRFESSVKDGIIHLRYGETSLSVPLAHISTHPTSEAA